MEKEQLKLDNQICFPLYATSRLVINAYRPLLEKLKLTYPQYLVMLVLWEESGVTVKYISEKLLLDTNTVTPLLKRMEKDGLLSRKRSEKDERSVLIELTEKGRGMQEQAAEIPIKIIEQLATDKVKVDEILALKNTLCRLMDSMTQK